MVLGTINEVKVTIPKNCHRRDSASLCIFVHALNGQCVVLEAGALVSLPFCHIGTSVISNDPCNQPIEIIIKCCLYFHTFQQNLL